MNNQKVVLIVGAGATVADVENRPENMRPPLDKKFFLTGESAGYNQVKIIRSYVQDKYHLDILVPENDSLEKVMARIYADILDPTLKDEASIVFRWLIHLFNQRLARTTNNIPANRFKYLYRIVVYYLKKGVTPNNIKIISFNQDLQIEKTLNKLEQVKRWKPSGKIFSFPSCYIVDFPEWRITMPVGKTKNVFSLENPTPNGIKILKLHGSLNWYSRHRSMNISPKAMLNPDRKIFLTQRQNIAPTMKFSKPYAGIKHTLPIIVPPVTHKSAIIHNEIKKLWGTADDILKEADEITIFGYSCPAMDFESTNLIQRTMKGNKNYDKLSIIDPDSNVLKHYVDLINPQPVSYYPKANYFLQ